MAECEVCGRNLRTGYKYCYAHRSYSKEPKKEAYMTPGEYSDYGMTGAIVIGGIAFIIISLLVYGLGDSKIKVYYTLFAVGIIGLIIFLKWLDRWAHSENKKQNKLKQKNFVDSVNDNIGRGLTNFINNQKKVNRINAHHKHHHRHHHKH